jgi:GT2 family glycosyltransferase
MKPKVSIIILNWNSWKDTIECLESIYKIEYPNYNVIVVDNGSEDNSISMIQKYVKGEINIKSDFFDFNNKNKPIELFEFENNKYDSFIKYENRFENISPDRKLILIKNDYDAGFSIGNNIGINFAQEHLDAEYIMLLSNDIVVDKDFLDKLITFASSNQKIGIVGPRVLYYDKPGKTAYLGRKVNLYTATTSDIYNEKKSYPSSLEVDYIVGCGLLIKNSVIENIGILNPNYFLYYEDVDWCTRARKNDYKVYSVPESKIWHKISSEESNSLTRYFYGTRNMFLFLRNNWSLMSLILLYPLLILNNILYVITLILKGKRKAAITVFKAIYDGIKGDYGYKEGYN